MRIKKIELKNFKRFTNLSISDIPTTSKVVLLIGANGSGKSSLFDAFDWLSKGVFKGIGPQEYYRKDKLQESIVKVSFTDGSTIQKIENQIIGPNELAKKFIGRSSIRIVPRIINNSDITAISDDRDSPSTYIDNDTRFLNDISLYINQIDFALREPVFKGEQVDVVKIFHESIKPLNDSLLKIFGGSESTQIKIAEFQNATPNTNAKLVFSKGNSKINYDLLSHGEKQVVILLLNFIVRSKYYDNSIIFIDEMDCHLNTGLQAKLLDEIVTTWIPDNSQLWTASHALGFIEYVKKSDKGSIIDFDLLNFDIDQELSPKAKDDIDVYDIAVPKDILSEILKGKKIIFCENQNDAFYNSSQIKDSIFIGLKDSREVFFTVKKDNNATGLRDRDFLMDSEVEKLKKKFPNYRILDYYNFENYIYHPDNIQEVNPAEFSKEEYIKEIVRQKNEQYDYIIADIKTSRNSYEEFKTDISKESDINSIMTDLKSNDLEKFYRYFDMKNKFAKKFLEPFNIPKSSLCKTNWFKSKIKGIVS